MRNKISKKYVVDFITSIHGEMIPNTADQYVKAIRKTAKRHELNEVDLFHFIYDEAGTIPMARECGFDTSYGRTIRRTFKYFYEYT